MSAFPPFETAVAREKAGRILMEMLGKTDCNVAEACDMIRAGADLSLRDMQGRSALMRGLRHPVAVGMMLDHGADPKARCHAGRNAVAYAVLYGAPPEVLALLAARGCDVNNADQDRATPLMEAAKGGAAHIEALLAAGADIHARDAAGRDALMHAAEDQNREAVEILLAAGADPLARDRRNLTALQMSDRIRQERQAQAVEAGKRRDFYIQEGDDRRAANHEGQARLMAGYARGAAEIAGMIGRCQKERQEQVAAAQAQSRRAGVTGKWQGERKRFILKGGRP